MANVVTGESKSRLNELEKYTVSGSFNDKYFGNGSVNNDGVDYNATNELTQIVYFIGGIRYVDVLNNSEYQKTEFSFTSEGHESIDFINLPYYKDPNKSKLISLPKIDDDVFIIRQELSAFDRVYRLEFIENLSDLQSYAGGRYFNIVNNS